MFTSNRKLWIYLFCLILFGYFLTLNFLMPRFSDDYFRLAVKDYDFIPIFRYIHWSYFHWLGRITTNFVTCALLWQGKASLYLFNFINAAISVFLFYMIFLLAYSRKPQGICDAVLLLIIFGISWFLLDGFGEAFFWKSAAITHVWAFTAILAFLYPYKKLIDQNNKDVGKTKDNWLNVFLFFCIGLILGDTLEHLTLTVFTLLLLAIFYLHLRDKRLPKWTWAGIVGYGLGSLILLFSPGEHAKVKAYNLLVTKLPSFLDRVEIRLKSIAMHYKFYFLLTLAVLVLVVVFDRFSVKNRLAWYLIFATAALISALAFIGAPFNVPFSGRMAFASDIFMIIAIANLIPFDVRKPCAKKILYLTVALFTPFLAINMYYVYKCFLDLDVQEKARQRIIHVSLLQNKKDILLPAFVFSIPPDSFFGFLQSCRGKIFTWDISFDKKNWVNKVFTEHYRLKSVRLKN